MFKILTACGTGINSSQQIARSIEEEMKNRGYDVKADPVIISDITKDLLEKYDLLAPISKIELGFESDVPMVEAGVILYRIPSMAQPIYDKIEEIIKNKEK